MASPDYVPPTLVAQHNPCSTGVGGRLPKRAAALAACSGKTRTFKEIATVGYFENRTSEFRAARTVGAALRRNTPPTVDGGYCSVQSCVGTQAPSQESIRPQVVIFLALAQGPVLRPLGLPDLEGELGILRGSTAIWAGRSADSAAPSMSPVFDPGTN
jgi:hypothetical protein